MSTQPDEAQQHLLDLIGLLKLTLGSQLNYLGRLVMSWMFFVPQPVISTELNAKY